MRGVRLALIASALAALTLYRVVLRVRPQALLSRAIAITDAETDTARNRPSPRLHLITSAVERAAGLCPFESGCLERALTIRTLLQCMGEQAHVVVGVTRARGVFDAHAWVEVDRQGVDGAREHYRRLAQLR